MTTDKKPSERLRPFREAYNAVASFSTGTVRKKHIELTNAIDTVLDDLHAKLNALMPKPEPTPTPTPAPSEHRQGCPANGGYGHGIEPCICKPPTPAPSGRAERARQWAEKMIQGPGYLSVGPNHPRGYSELSNSVFLAEQTPESMGFAQASCARWLTAFAAAAEVTATDMRQHAKEWEEMHGKALARATTAESDRDQLRLRVEAMDRVITALEVFGTCTADSMAYKDSPSAMTSILERMRNAYRELEEAKSALAKLAEEKHK